MKHLSSAELLSRTKILVADERRATLALIEHLEEVQARRLYAELGFSSMWEFATQELGLSEGAAQRRLQAMRLLRDVPSAKPALESGELSLSNAAKVQSFRQAEKKQGRSPDPRKLVEQVKDLSQRECEQKLFEISPSSMPQERERIVSAVEDRELKIVVSAELYEKLQRLKGLKGHAMPDASYAELLEYLTDQELARLEKQKGIALDPVVARTAAAAAEEQKAPKPAGERGYIAIAVKRAVWARSGGRCEVTVKGRRCTSKHRLELDHVTPLAHGGSNELDNFQLACKSHNLQRFRASCQGRQRGDDGQGDKAAT